MSVIMVKVKPVLVKHVWIFSKIPVTVATLKFPSKFWVDDFRERTTETGFLFLAVDYQLCLLNFISLADLKSST